MHDIPSPARVKLPSQRHSTPRLYNNNVGKPKVAPTIPIYLLPGQYSANPSLPLFPNLTYTRKDFCEQCSFEYTLPRPSISYRAQSFTRKNDCTKMFQLLDISLFFAFAGRTGAGPGNVTSTSRYTDEDRQTRGTSVDASTIMRTRRSCFRCIAVQGDIA